MKLDDWRDAPAQGPADRTRVRVMHVAMAMVLACREFTPPCNKHGLELEGACH